MKRDHRQHRLGTQQLSPEVEKCLFPDGRPSEASSIDNYIRRRIRNEAVREFLLAGKGD